MKKNTFKLLTTLAFVLAVLVTFGQSTNVPFGSPIYHTMDRLEIKSGKFAPFHSFHKSYKKRDVTQFALMVDTMSGVQLSSLDRSDLQYIYRDNWIYLDKDNILSEEHPKYEASQKKLLKYFYNTPAKFIELGDENYYVTLQPLFDRQYGSESTESNRSATIGQAEGGFIEGNINNKIHFYTSLEIYFDRHQAHMRNYANEFQALPGIGAYRGGNETLGVDSLYDYINSSAYLDFNVSKNIQLQFGYGKLFMGDGFRSTYLSDFSNNFLYLKTNTNVGIFDYQNIFAEMSQLPTNLTTSKQVLRKYFVGHHVSMNVLKNLNIGFFEALILSREYGFELNYLNPIIFYRTIERNLDSPDNAYAGLDFKWNFLKRFSMYGQLGVDELHSSRLVSHPNSWAHKFARQIGIKYIDALGIDHLDVQLEYNSIRPYTYSHWDSSKTYSHFGMPLAHPLGANFKEFIGIVRYQPSDKLFFEARLMSARTGRDTLGADYGSNIFINYNDRVSDEAPMLQGVRTDILMLDFWGSYMIRHNLAFDLRFQYRTENSELDGFDKKQVFYSLGLRYNFWRKRNVF